MNIVVNLMHLNVSWPLAHSTLQSLASKRFWLCWLTSVLAVWPDAPYCLCALSLPAHLDGHRTGVLLAADRAPVIWAGASYSNKCRKINSTISSSNVFTTFSGPNLAFLGGFPLWGEGQDAYLFFTWHLWKTDAMINASMARIFITC